MEASHNLFYADNDSNIAEIREWMEEHLKNVKSLRLPHPVLHEAAHQRAYRGAGLILWVAWNDERWRPFFNDPTYLDKYGKRAWQRLNITTPGVEVTQLPGDPDFLEVRHHIYLSRWLNTWNGLAPKLLLLSLHRFLPLCLRRTRTFW